LIGAPYREAFIGRAQTALAWPWLAWQWLAWLCAAGLTRLALADPGGLARAEPGGTARGELEHADGGTPLWAVDGRQLRPGDASLIDRCGGPTLDVGSGPGRLTVALAERGVLALGIDVTPPAAHQAHLVGALTLQRDVFGRVPGTGRWMSVLLADGSIGIGGDPVALLRRVAELLAPRGQALVEVEPPGQELRRERARLWDGTPAGDWLPWAHVGLEQLSGIAGQAGLSSGETWSSNGRWFVTLRKGLC
jgi:SAM-dependent methyltransferase